MSFNSCLTPSNDLSFDLFLIYFILRDLLFLLRNSFSLFFFRIFIIHFNIIILLLQSLFFEFLLLKCHSLSVIKFLSLKVVFAQFPPTIYESLLFEKINGIIICISENVFNLPLSLNLL